MDKVQPNAVDYAKRVYGYFKNAPNETRVREAINFVQCLARVEYWPSHNLQSHWVKAVITEIQKLGLQCQLEGKA